MKDRFLSYYNNEMRYLRQSGKNFAKQYPKIARRLELSDATSPDPHTERLIESFAFLTAKLNQEIDDRYPELASTLLGVLFPHLVNPVPSMSIAHFKPDLSKVKQTVGYSLPRHTPLFTYTEEGIPCRFRTVYPVKLWPLKVMEVSFKPQENYNLISNNSQAAKAGFLSIKLAIEGGLNWADLNTDELVFYLNGERSVTVPLYQLIMGKTLPQVFIATESLTNKSITTKPWAHMLPVNSLQEVGFAKDDISLPINNNTTHAYQLLQEYFHLPEKFLFFKVTNIAAIKIAPECQSFELLFPTDGIENFLQQNLHPELFLTGCTPIINLFQRATEPLRLTRRKTDYLLIPDQRQDKTTEIHSIQRVIATVEGETTPNILLPYFSFNHQNNPYQEKQTADTIYWFSKRVSSINRDLPGTDLHISFVDLNFKPSIPPQHIIYGETLCTNRFLAAQLPYNAPLQIEEVAPLSSITCLMKPTVPLYSPSDGESLWQLVSQLSMNYLGLNSGGDSLATLREMLSLFAGADPKVSNKEIEQLIGVKAGKKIRRFGREAWRGFVQGTEICLSFKQFSERGDTVFLLASVLRHYFALNIEINSFVEVVMQREKDGINSTFDTLNSTLIEEMRWPLLPGVKTQL